MWALALVVSDPAGAQVFCFFFSKKKRLPFLPFSHPAFLELFRPGA
jgi:hypothetical protein